VIQPEARPIKAAAAAQALKIPENGIRVYARQKGSVHQGLTVRDTGVTLQGYGMKHLRHKPIRRYFTVGVHV
jgi:hypothetical protein